MIKLVSFHRFKQFNDRQIKLLPSGISLIAGANNAGKSSVLHGLAIWEFCRTAIEMERGSESFVAGWSGQGQGLGDDEFSPINVPSLKHLWTNLKTQRGSEPDGYTLKIGATWDVDGVERTLEFGLALSNDRLFIKPTASDLATGDRVPRIAYLPPFAGIGAREMRLPMAIRRRRIGEGLAGAVLRNTLLDMYDRNITERARLRGEKSKISDPDLHRLRDSDPWELLQDTLRTTFQAELELEPFREEYHSYIRVEVVKGLLAERELKKYPGVIDRKLKRHPNYNKRDLMVEGSGFLQWLSVYALALDPDIQVLLLDEPDAHLHSSLQEQMLEKLKTLALATGKQVLVATHSTELLRNARPETILEVRGGGKAAKYLSEEHQKVGLLAGLGSDYAPRIDGIKKTKRVFFFEGTSDVALLKIMASTIGVTWPSKWVAWRTPAGQKERLALFRALSEEVPGVVAYSLRDRDDEPLGTVGDALEDKGIEAPSEFHARKWRRRHIESYLVWPPAIAAVAGMSTKEVEDELRDRFAVAVAEDAFKAGAAPQALLDLRGKAVLKEGGDAILSQFNADVYDVARALPAEVVPDDVRLVLNELVQLE
jgi:Predicted ATPases